MVRRKVNNLHSYLYIALLYFHVVGRRPTESLSREIDVPIERNMLSCNFIVISLCNRIQCDVSHLSM